MILFFFTRLSLTIPVCLLIPLLTCSSILNNFPLTIIVCYLSISSLNFIISFTVVEFFTSEYLILKTSILFLYPKEPNHFYSVFLIQLDFGYLFLNIAYQDLFNYNL